MRMLTHLWTCEAADTDWSTHFAVETVSFEEQVGMRGRWRTADLDELLPKALTFAADLDGAAVSVLPYALTDQWNAAVRGRSTLTVPPRLLTPSLAELANKITMRAWFRSLHLRVPASITLHRSELDYLLASKHVGAVFVLQVPSGSAGIGTYLVRDQPDVDAALQNHPGVNRWLVSAFAGHTTVNVHGLVVGEQVELAPPSVQLTNIDETGSGFGEYCGTDFYASGALSTMALEQCHMAADRIGASLTRLGFQGIFGIDFAVNDETAEVLELNARIQASTWLLGENEFAAGKLPMLCRYFLSTYRGVAQGSSNVRSDAAAGVQLVVRHVGPAARVDAAPHAGVYDIDGSNLVWKRNGVGLLACGSTEVVLCGVPRPGVSIRAGAPICRLITRESLTDINGQTLNGPGARIIAAARNHFSFTPINPAK